MDFYKEQPGNISLDSQHECSRIEMQKGLLSRNRHVHVPEENNNEQELLKIRVNLLQKSIDQCYVCCLKGFTDNNEVHYRENERVFHSKQSSMPTKSGNRNCYIDDCNTNKTEKKPKTISLSSNILSDSTSNKIMKRKSSNIIPYFDPRSGGSITFDSSISRITLSRTMPRRRSF